MKKAKADWVESKREHCLDFKFVASLTEYASKSEPLT
jgi:hypothetical protein